MKKNGRGLFDVTMGCFDGAEVCELVGTYALSKIAHEINSSDVGLYRDDGLAVLRDVTGSEADRMRKTVCKIFNNLGLRLTIDTGMKVVNFLDVTLNLADGTYRPYRKPNDTPVYVHSQSNHPPTIIKQIPKAISRRLTDISSNQDAFREAAPLYNSALRNSGYAEGLEYLEERDKDSSKKKKNRRRNIIWYNPPFSKTVATNIGQRFLRLIEIHFPAGSRLHKIFNRNTVKVSYSCMPNMSAMVKSHNNSVKRKSGNNDGQPKERRCNCRDKAQCPMDGNCQISSIVYKATVQITGEDRQKEYIGLTEPEFKKRYGNHLTSFRHERHEKSTELSKCVWNMKRQNSEYSLGWSVIAQTPGYSNITKRCPLCLREKLEILQADKRVNINKRSELVSKCRHENKYFLSKFSPSAVT